MTNAIQKFSIDDKGDDGSGGVVASCRPTSSRQP